MRRYCCIIAVWMLCGCSSTSLECLSPQGKEVVYVVSYGWHAEIGIPAENLGPDLVFLRALFPQAQTLMFSYGKRTFLTAPPDAVGEYFFGPIPGPALIQVFALNSKASEVYAAGDSITLTLPPGGSRALSAYIGNDIAKDASGKALVVAPSTDPAGIFYTANSEYNLLHTCNAWTADALQAAGIALSGDGVLFSGQVMARAEEARDSQCQSVR